MNQGKPHSLIVLDPMRLLRRLVLFFALGFAVFCARADDDTNQAQNLADMPLEELMQIQVPEVYSASKFEQKATEAPSSTTVITSDEIKFYG